VVREKLQVTAQSSRSARVSPLTRPWAQGCHFPFRQYTSKGEPDAANDVFVRLTYHEKERGLPQLTLFTKTRVV
jgi:hypothetical protein